MLKDLYNFIITCKNGFQIYFVLDFLIVEFDKYKNIMRYKKYTFTKSKYILYDVGSLLCIKYIRL